MDDPGSGHAEVVLLQRRRLALVRPACHLDSEKSGQVAAPTGPATLLRRNGSTTRATAAGSSANGQ